MSDPTAALAAAILTVTFGYALAVWLFARRAPRRDCGWCALRRDHVARHTDKRWPW